MKLHPVLSSYHITEKHLSLRSVGKSVIQGFTGITGYSRQSISESRVFRFHACIWFIRTPPNSSITITIISICNAPADVSSSLELIVNLNTSQSRRYSRSRSRGRGGDAMGSSRNHFLRTYIIYMYLAYAPMLHVHVGILVFIAAIHGTYNS